MVYLATTGNKIIIFRRTYLVRELPILVSTFYCSFFGICRTLCWRAGSGAVVLLLLVLLQLA
jgi:hypothetical protein